MEKKRSARPFGDEHISDDGEADIYCVACCLKIVANTTVVLGTEYIFFHYGLLVVHIPILCKISDYSSNNLIGLVN